MNKFNKGFVPLIAIIAIVVVVLIGGGIVYYFATKKPLTTQTQQTNLQENNQNQNQQNNQQQNTQNQTKAFITVTAPTNGQTLEIGKTYTIKWNSSGINKVNIQLLNKSRSAFSSDIAKNVANTGSYSWTLPAGIIGLDYAQNDGNTIYVMSSVYPYTSGQVDNINLLEPQSYIEPDIKVTSPQAGERLTQGKDIAVKWTSQGLTDKVDIQVTYYNPNGVAPMNGGECKLVYSSIPTNVGSFTIPANNTNQCQTLKTSTKVIILIQGKTALNGHPINDASDNDFTVTNPK